MTSSQHTIVDLFCGCGGMSLGFQNAGFEVIAAFDHWDPAVEVYRKNFDHSVEKLDIGSPKVIEAVTKLEPSIIIGGPPCQDFSSAGYKKYSSSRANLAKRFARIVINSKPEFFVLENVPRIRNSKIYNELVEDFRLAGYGLTEKILDASYCGVPQARKRLFLVGGINSEDGFLDEILDNNLSKKRLTMRAYFGNELGFDYYFRIPTNYQRRGIFSVDEPCVTIRVIDRPIPKGYLGHPADPIPLSLGVRGLTVRERSYVQTFPKTFKFDSTKTNLNQMIGNAVPVKLAEFIAKAISEYQEKQLYEFGNNRLAS